MNKKIIFKFLFDFFYKNKRFSKVFIQILKLNFHLKPFFKK